MQWRPVAGKAIIHGFPERIPNPLTKDPAMSDAQTQIDQLVKLLSAADVKALLYGPECSYLGRTVKPLTSEEGGLV